MKNIIALIFLFAIAISYVYAQETDETELGKKNLIIEEPLIEVLVSWIKDFVFKNSKKEDH